MEKSVKRRYISTVKINIKRAKRRNDQLLDLSTQRLWTIPKSVFTLSNIKYLSFHNNCIQILPDCISMLTNLEKLYLSYNKLCLLPNGVSNLIHLNHLYVNVNNLKCVPIWISNLTGLTELSLSDNYLESIPDEISKLTKLNLLHLANKNSPDDDLEDTNETFKNVILRNKPKKSRARSAILCLMWCKKNNTCNYLRIIDRNVIRKIAEYVWESRYESCWELK